MIATLTNSLKQGPQRSRRVHQFSRRRSLRIEIEVRCYFATDGDPFVTSSFAGVHIPYICSPPLSALAVLRHGSACRTFHKSSGSEFFLALRRLLCARSPLSRDGPFLRAFPVSTCLVVPFCSLASPFEKLQREPELKFVRTPRRGAAPDVNRRMTSQKGQ